MGVVSTFTSRRRGLQRLCQRGAGDSCAGVSRTKLLARGTASGADHAERVEVGCWRTAGRRRAPLAARLPLGQGLPGRWSSRPAPPIGRALLSEAICGVVVGARQPRLSPPTLGAGAADDRQ